MIQLLLIVTLLLNTCGYAGSHLSQDPSTMTRQEKQQLQNEEVLQLNLLALLHDDPQDPLQVQRIREKIQEAIDQMTSGLSGIELINDVFGRKRALEQDPILLPADLYTFDTFKKDLEEMHDVLKTGKDASEKKKERDELSKLADAHKVDFEQFLAIGRETFKASGFFLNELKKETHPVVQNFYITLLGDKKKKFAELTECFVKIVDLTKVELFNTSMSQFRLAVKDFFDQMPEKITALKALHEEIKELEKEYNKFDPHVAVTDSSLDQVLETLQRQAAQPNIPFVIEVLRDAQLVIGKHKSEKAKNVKDQNEEYFITSEQLAQYKVFCDHAHMLKHDRIVYDSFISDCKHWGMLTLVIVVVGGFGYKKYQDSQERYLGLLRSKLFYAKADRKEKETLELALDSKMMQWIPLWLRKMTGHDELDQRIEVLYQETKEARAQSRSDQ